MFSFNLLKIYWASGGNGNVLQRFETLIFSVNFGTDQERVQTNANNLYYISMKQSL